MQEKLEIKANPKDIVEALISLVQKQHKRIELLENLIDQLADVGLLHNKRLENLEVLLVKLHLDVKHQATATHES